MIPSTAWILRRIITISFSSRKYASWAYLAICVLIGCCCPNSYTVFFENSAYLRETKLDCPHKAYKNRQAGVLTLRARYICLNTSTCSKTASIFTSLEEDTEHCALHVAARRFKYDVSWLQSSRCSDITDLQGSHRYDKYHEPQTSPGLC